MCSLCSLSQVHSLTLNTLSVIKFKKSRRLVDVSEGRKKGPSAQTKSTAAWEGKAMPNSLWCLRALWWRQQSNYGTAKDRHWAGELREREAEEERKMKIKIRKWWGKGSLRDLKSPVHHGILLNSTVIISASIWKINQLFAHIFLKSDVCIYYLLSKLLLISFLLCSWFGYMWCLAVTICYLRL